MTSEDRGHYSNKHPEGRETNPEIVKEIEKKVNNGNLTCSAASIIAGNAGVSPGEIGFTLDMMEVRIIRCQMGIFGYEPEKKVVKSMDTVSGELESAIRDKLIEGKLSCTLAWEIAKNLKIPKMDVSSACEKLGIKINSCQLGAF